MWSTLRCASHFLVFKTSGRAYSTAPPAPLLAIRQRAQNAWDDLLNDEWVDNELLGLKTETAESVIEDYRPLFDAKAVEDHGDARDVYQTVEQLYTLKEAAKLVDLYSMYMKDLILDQMDNSGFLGNKTTVSSEDAVKAETTLKEYVDFVNSFENDRIRRKVEEQLGRKAIQVRQVYSIENFANRVMPIATDHIVTRVKAPRTTL